MAKKIFDIVPPKPGRNVENTVKDFTKDIKKKKPATEVFYKKERRFPLKGVLVGAAVLIILLCVYGYIKLPKADVRIWPKMETVNLSEKITADTLVKIVDIDSNSIPAQYMEIEKEAEREFPATGIAAQDGKATGTITIYNKISPAGPFTLIKGTHFLSDSGKYFVTLDKVVIPAAKNKVPGSVNVKVQAEQPGEDYNIKASKFSIPKLNGSPYYYSIYGESSNPMEGGYTGKVKQVTSNDIESAKDVVVKSLLTDAQSALKSSVSEGQILLDGVIETKVIDTRADKKTGQVTDTFKEYVKVKAYAIAFKKQDMEEFVKSRISSGMPDGVSILEKSMVINHDLESFDTQKGTVVLSLNASAKTYSNIDTDSLVGLFAMKSADQIKQIVDQMHEGQISQLKVNFWPFWVTKAPSNTKRIKVDLNFE